MGAGIVYNMEELLNTKETQDYWPVLHIFTDWTVLPQFKDVLYTRLDRESWGDKAKYIKEKVESLTKPVNKMIEKEYEMPDRRHINRRRTAFGILRFCVVLLWIIIGIILISKFDSGRPLNSNLFEILLFRTFILLFVVGVVGIIFYYLCCDGSDILLLMDARLEQKLKPTLHKWNTEMSEHQIFVEIKMYDEPSLKGNLVRISPTLKLWKLPRYNL